MALENILNSGGMYLNSEALENEYVDSNGNLKVIPSTENLERVVGGLGITKRPYADMTLDGLRKTPGDLPGMINENKEVYGKQLANNDFDVNAIVFIITDGADNASGDINSSSVKEALKTIMKEEALESILSILVGVGVGGYADIAAYLDDFKKEAGLNQYVEIKNANNKTLAKLADFISKSVSSQSNSLGSGSMSQPLTF